MELKDQGFSISGMDTFLLISKRFLFIMAITLPFDIRDMYQDRKFHLKTIPVLMGEKRSLILCQMLLLVYIISIIFYRNDKFNRYCADGYYGFHGYINCKFEIQKK